MSRSTLRKSVKPRPPSTRPPSREDGTDVIEGLQNQQDGKGAVDEAGGLDPAHQPDDPLRPPGIEVLLRQAGEGQYVERKDQEEVLDPLRQGEALHRWPAAPSVHPRSPFSRPPAQRPRAGTLGITRNPSPRGLSGR